MSISEYFKTVFAAILASKLRSVLAIVGIIWGAFTLIMLFAIGSGIFNYNKQQLQGLLNPTSFVVLQKTTMPYMGFGPNRQLSLSYQQLLNMVINVPTIQHATPYNNKSLTISTQRKSAKSQQVAGVLPNYFGMFGTALYGRAFQARDQREGLRVIVLSSKLKERLFGDQSALGKWVTISGVPFKIVGYPKRASGTNLNFNTSFIPFSTYDHLWHEPIKVMVIQLHQGAHFDAFKKQLTQYLAHTFHASSNDPGLLMAYNLVELADSLTLIIWSVRLFLAFCGLMTLVVGGISVANMMVLVIKERTRVIGLQMALGATPRNIIIQFLLETLMLVFLGSLIATLLAGLLLSVLNSGHLPAWLGNPHLNWGVSFIIAALLLITALLAGYFPARSAALMSPVEALTGGR